MRTGTILLSAVRNVVIRSSRSRLPINEGATKRTRRSVAAAIPRTSWISDLRPKSSTSTWWTQEQVRARHESSSGSSKRVEGSLHSPGVVLGRHCRVLFRRLGHSGFHRGGVGCTRGLGALLSYRQLQSIAPCSLHNCMRLASRSGRHLRTWHALFGSSNLAACQGLTRCRRRRLCSAGHTSRASTVICAQGPLEI